MLKSSRKSKRGDMMVEYDVIIIGAGSIGVPTAMFTSRSGLKTLVIDTFPSVAQGDNKHAIGGIRATHTLKSKIWLCQRSIELFSKWREEHGDDIWWSRGGYTFLARSEQDANMLKNTVKRQRAFGLNIRYIDAEQIKQLIPGINDAGLLGGTHSPEDGNASPLLAMHAMFRKSKEYGASFKFNETAINLIKKSKKITGVKTTRRKYSSRFVINAAGANAKKIGEMTGIDTPVEPDSHEAGITEPVKQFFSTMVVDITPGNDSRFGNSRNYYFYQNREGKILFCLTPEPRLKGTDRQETGLFLPQISKRMVSILPRLRNIKIRRTWRGLYPMTPDGNPIIGKVDDCEGYINSVGMCGQGFMLGPGVGELLCRLITSKLTHKDHEILNELSHGRDFGKEEELK